ncbi:MAG: phage tail protein [Verrucomicrobia bacterium]|nr:phage tail protein [Verrucomicrobiota bacterium]
METDRRNFLKRCSGVAAAMVAVPELVQETTASAQERVASGNVVVGGAAPAAARSYAAGKFGIELDGLFAGWVYSTEGGNATADVVLEKLGSDNIQRKHIGGVKYEDITVACGTGMSKGFYEWIKASFDQKPLRKNGAIIAADFNAVELSRLSFSNALITGIGFPALDAASKDAAKMTIKFSPEYTRLSFGGGGTIQSQTAKQKAWLTSNFRLEIGGLDATRVNKIEALVIKQNVVENPAGTQRDYRKEPANLEVPNLVITFPESHATDFYQWHEDFVIKGNNGQEQEKSGALGFLAPNLQESLFTLSFGHLGIFKLAPETPETSGQSIRRLKAEMYCEEIKFDYGGSTAVG